MRRKWGSGWPSAWKAGEWMKLPPRRWGSQSGRLLPERRTRLWKSNGPRKRPRFKRRYYVLIAGLLFLFMLIQTLIFFDRELRGPLLFLAKIKVNQLATEAINTALSEEIAQYADSRKLVDWRLDAEGKVTGFLIDYKEQMNLTSRTIQVVQRVLEERGAIPEKIPIGHALNSPIISSIGPSVSVKYYPESAVKVDIDTRSTSAGINMVQVEVYMRIRTEIAVIIPFDREPELLETEIPLSYVMVVGDVPLFYYDNKGNPVSSEAAADPPQLKLEKGS